MQSMVERLFWHDPEIRALSPEGKLVAAYLMFTPYLHISGLFPMTTGLIAADTGLAPEVVDTLWNPLSVMKFCYRDEAGGLVWVRNLLRKQGPGQQNEKAAAKQVQAYRKSPLAEKLLEYYPAVRRWLPKGRVSNTLSDFDPAKVEMPVALHGTIFRAGWLTWIKHRREIKKPLTPTSVAKQLKFLAGLGTQRAMQSIDQSIEKGWIGLFSGEGRSSGAEAGVSQPVRTPGRTHE